ncbi:hypothetical protein RYA05_02105 [Pseudomonas syringae pv. actinidiae]|nr:hypothetical protein [Pseudomonas syringae pv. actinidiae]
MFYFTNIEKARGGKTVLEIRWYKTKVGYLLDRGTYKGNPDTWELVRLPDFKQIALSSCTQAQAVANIKAMGPGLFDCGKEFIVRVESFLGVVIFITDVSLEYDIKRYTWAWTISDAKPLTKAAAREMASNFRLDGRKNEFGDYYVKVSSVDRRTGISVFSQSISEEYVTITKSMLLTNKPLSDILKPSEIITRNR